MERFKDLDIPLYMKKQTNVGRVKDIIGREELTVSKRYQTISYRTIDSFKPISKATFTVEDNGNSII